MSALDPVVKTEENSWTKKSNNSNNHRSKGFTMCACTCFTVKWFFRPKMQQKKSDSQMLQGPDMKFSILPTSHCIT